MKHIEQWLFLAFILTWIVLVSIAVELGGLVHLLPLAAVCLLANRVRRCSAEPPLACTEARDRATPSLAPPSLATPSHATHGRTAPDEAIPAHATRDQAAEAPIAAL